MNECSIVPRKSVNVEVDEQHDEGWYEEGYERGEDGVGGVEVQRAHVVLGRDGGGGDGLKDEINRSGVGLLFHNAIRLIRVITRNMI